MNGKRILQTYLGIILSLFISCGPGAVPFDPSYPPNNRAIIYCYYPYMGAWIGDKWIIYDNDELAFSVQDGEYVEYLVEPGKHVFRTKTIFIDEPLHINIEPGEIHYFQLEWQQEGLTGRHIINRMYPEQAIEELKFCRKIEIKR